MIIKIYNFFGRLGIWPVVAILVVVLMISYQSFVGRQEVLGNAVRTLDGRRWYTPADVVQLFTIMGNQRYFYAVTEVTLDLIFPLAYGLLFAILLVRTWEIRFAWLVLFPIFTVIADLFENALIFYLAFTFTGAISGLAWFAAVCSLIKSMLFLATMLVLLNGGVITLFTQPSAADHLSL
jgi:hypothetical protein